MGWRWPMDPRDRRREHHVRSQYGLAGWLNIVDGRQQRDAAAHLYEQHSAGQQLGDLWRRDRRGQHRNRLLLPWIDVPERDLCWLEPRVLSGGQLLSKLVERRW